MQITDEIIAAYIEGKVSTTERVIIRNYLAVHPEMQDLVLALMDSSDDEDIPEKKTSVKTLPPQQSFTDIALAAAAFAPRIATLHKKNNKEDFIGDRRKRMTNFWDELNID